jgi:hypothetical protein
MHVTANKSISKFLTSGKSYEVISENENNYIVIADDGEPLGFSKNHFEEVKETISRKQMALLILDQYDMNEDDRMFLDEIINELKD